MAAPRHWDQDKESTLYIGNLDERTTDAIIWELMLQAGPIINVHLPKDRVTQTHQGYGFVEFGSEEDAEYAVKIMNQIRLWGKPIRVNKATADKKGAAGGPDGVSQGVGAELFVGNLDGMVDEKVLYETFSRFGPLLAPPKITRGDDNLSKGYGFISYAAFEASDDAIANMHGQFLMNKEITVQYAYKKDGKGERHGDAAERALAAQAKKHGVQVEIPAMPASLVGHPAAPSAPAVMNGGYGAPNALQGAPQQPAGYPPNYGMYNQGGYGGYGNQQAPMSAYNNMPPPPMFSSAQQQPSWTQTAWNQQQQYYPPNQAQNYYGGQSGYPQQIYQPPPAFPPSTQGSGFYPPPPTQGAGYYPPPLTQQQSPNSMPQAQSRQGVGQSAPYHGNASNLSSSAYSDPQNYSVPGQNKPNRNSTSSPIVPPPGAAGLPARPPPSQAGYGGPDNAPGMEHVGARGGGRGRGGRGGKRKDETSPDEEDEGPKYTE